jgi:EpsI family protein
MDPTDDDRVEQSPESHVGGGAMPGRAELALVLLLVLVGGIGWWISLRPGAELDAATLEEIPLELDDWSGVDLPMASSVEAMLRADSQVQRAYRTRDGEVVWIYVGYYGTERGGRPEHTPWACYPSAGWVIERSSERDRSPPDGPTPGGRLNELLVERNGERRLVHFWYRTHRSEAIASEVRLTLDHLLGRLSDRARADGALVRLSTPIGVGGLAAARARLERFAVEVGPELARHWPEGARPQRS